MNNNKLFSKSKKGNFINTNPKLTQNQNQKNRQNIVTLNVKLKTSGQFVWVNKWTYTLHIFQLHCHYSLIPCNSFGLFRKNQFRFQTKKKRQIFFPRVEIVKVLLLIEANNLCHHSLNLKKLIQLELMQAVYKRHHKVRTSNWTSGVIEWLKGCIKQQMLLRLCGG